MFLFVLQHLQLNPKMKHSKPRGFVWGQLREPSTSSYSVVKDPDQQPQLDVSKVPHQQSVCAQNPNTQTSLNTPLCQGNQVPTSCHWLPLLHPFSSALRSPLTETIIEFNLILSPSHNLSSPPVHVQTPALIFYLKRPALLLLLILLHLHNFPLQLHSLNTEKSPSVLLMFKKTCGHCLTPSPSRQSLIYCPLNIHTSTPLNLISPASPKDSPSSNLLSSPISPTKYQPTPHFNSEI